MFAFSLVEVHLHESYLSYGACRLVVHIGALLEYLQAIDEMQAEGVTNIVPRASIPARKTRLRNHSPAIEEDPELSSSNEGALESLRGVDRRGICEDILVGGHVQTFVDFFYLTHRAGPLHGEPFTVGGSGKEN